MSPPIAAGTALPPDIWGNCLLALPLLPNRLLFSLNAWDFRFELGDELLEIRIDAEVFQVIVG